MEFKNLIGLTPVEFTFQIINTIVIFIIVKKLLFKPVMEIINARESEIQLSLSEGERVKKEGYKLKEQYEKEMSQAKEQGQEIIKQATLRATQKEEEIITSAKNEAKAIVDKANKDIAQEKQKAINEIKNDISEIAILAASKVIEKDIDKSKHQELINNFINEVALDGSK